MDGKIRRQYLVSFWNACVNSLCSDQRTIARWCVEHVRSPGGGSPLYNLMEVKYKRIARAMAARLGLKEARSKSRGLMHKNRMRQLGADERTNDRKVHIHQASKL